MTSALAELPAADSLNGRVVRRVRALKGLWGVSQQQLATALGMAQTQVSRRLRGTQPFSLEDIEQFAAYFHVTPGYLLGYEEGPRREGEGLSARPEGFEPPTFCEGVSDITPLPTRNPNTPEHNTPATIITGPWAATAG